jgi:hypothetical protein
MTPRRPPPPEQTQQEDEIFFLFSPFLWCCLELFVLSRFLLALLFLVARKEQNFLIILIIKVQVVQ